MATAHERQAADKRAVLSATDVPYPRIQAGARGLARRHVGHTAFLPGLAALTLFALCLALNRGLASLGLFDARAAATTVRAWMTLFAATPGIGRLVGGGAPLPGLLDLPLALIPGFPARLPAAIVAAGMDVALLAAVSSGLRALGVRGRARWMLLTLCALQPALLVSAGLGAPAMTSAAVLAWFVVFIIRWRVRDRALDLVLASFTAGIACLASWWNLLPAALFLLLVLTFPLSERGSLRARALTIACATPIVGLLLPWLLIAALAGVNPFHESSPGSGLAGSSSLASAAPLGMLLLAVTCGAVCWPALVRRAVRGQTLEAALLVVDAAVLAPAVFALASSGRPSAGSILPLLPVGVLLLGWLLGSRLTERGAGEQPPAAPGRALAALGAGLLLIASAVVQVRAWGEGLGSSAEQAVAAIISTGQIETPTTAARELGAYVATHHAGRDVLLDNRRASTIMYFAGSARWFFTPGDRAFGLLTQEPLAYLGYVLVSSAPPGAPPDRVGSAFPGLFKSGAAWATLERSWPAQGPAGRTWRLYRVLTRS